MKNDNLVDIRSRKSTVLVYIALAVFIVFKLWERTTISYRLGAIKYNGITAAVMGLLILRLIIRDYKSLKWIIADVLVVAGAFSLTGMWGYNKELVTLALLIMASFGTSFYNLVKTSFISVAAMTGFVLCCYGLGFAENLRFIRIHDSDVFYVNSLGFDAYATLSYCAFILTTGYLFLRKASFKYWEIPIILVLDFFVFKITTSYFFSFLYVYYIFIFQFFNFAAFSLRTSRNYGKIAVKAGDPMNEIATLGNRDGFSIFSFGSRNIRFKAPYSLERYTSVKDWNNGYLVVMAKYRHNPQPEEEYIDLLPILNNLYINAQEFLKPIKEVAIAHG